MNWTKGLKKTWLIKGKPPISWKKRKVHPQTSYNGVVNRSLNLETDNKAKYKAQPLSIYEVESSSSNENFQMEMLRMTNN
jgi:hypothetical protein